MLTFTKKKKLSKESNNIFSESEIKTLKKIVWHLAEGIFVPFGPFWSTFDPLLVHFLSLFSLFFFCQLLDWILVNFSQFFIFGQFSPIFKVLYDSYFDQIGQFSSLFPFSSKILSSNQLQSQNALESKKEIP